MKIKIPVTIITTLKHTDNPKMYCAKDVGGKQEETEVEVEIDEDVAKAFRCMFPSNILEVAISGKKEFMDGEEIT